MSDTEKRMNAIERGEDDDVPQLRMVVLVIVFAPPITVFSIAVLSELVEELKDPSTRPWVYLIVAGDLMYLTIAGLIAVYGHSAGHAVEVWLVSGITWVAQFDPQLVWEPWQAILAMFAAGLVLFLVGYRGVAHHYDC